MFTPMQEKRIIYGLGQCGVAVVIEKIDAIKLAKNLDYFLMLKTFFAIVWIIKSNKSADGEARTTTRLASALEKWP